MITVLYTKIKMCAKVSLAGMYQGVAIISGSTVESSPLFSPLFDQNQNLTGFLNNFFNIAISVGAILAVMRIAWAGYLYIGSDLWTKKEQGREILQDVALGLLLLLAIFIILKQINPDILKLNAFYDSVKEGQIAR
ncbi:MAG TPA: hypothetical protein VJH33_03150 [Candidatus Paceibacterota bacterium]